MKCKTHLQNFDYDVRGRTVQAGGRLVQYENLWLRESMDKLVFEDFRLRTFGSKLTLLIISKPMESRLRSPPEHRNE